MSIIRSLKEDIRACTECRAHLPFGPRPIVQFSENSKILIAGQAPGRKVHETGIPFNDPSGDRLRNWLGVSRDTFYNESQFAILPMGFCYPGSGNSGDLAPRPECAEKWRSALLDTLENIQLTLVIGQYAMAYHLPKEHGNLTATVSKWQSFLPSIIPLPHPSPRNNRWLKQNPWFELEMLPNVRKHLALALAQDP
jgi:uracil-DNA glycosylase